MMKHTKKGVTLVELVITCAIIVMLGGACTAVLISGQHVYSTSASAANATLEANVLQTYMLNLLPSSSVVELVADSDDAVDKTTGNYLYFNDEDQFVIQTDGKTTIVNGVTEFTYSFEKAGASNTARAQFVYTATMDDGSTYSGGFVLGNVKYADLPVDGDGNVIAGELADDGTAIYFSSAPADPTGTT